MASSSFGLTSQSKYDVFLSFRGEDTRDNFTSHLHAALCRKKIKTFIDEELNRGDEISPAILKAIEGSKITVIIFSKNYASSKWCLDELVKILECHKMNSQMVVPVFYRIDPSDVRKQSGRFKDAFVKHEKQFKDMPEKIQIWRAVWTEASNLSGWDSMTIRSEAQLVEVIVKDILEKLEKITIPKDFDGLIGLNSRIQKIKSLLCIGLPVFRIIGIWGMGGMGKTTIAGAIFNLISSEFEGKCFMANVREESEKVGGLVHLREQVLSEVLEENITIRTPDLPEYIRERLKRMKIFIVLDDVNKVRQLEDKRVLDNFGVPNTNIYKVKGLNYSEALELFCNFAFKQSNCPDDLSTLSKHIVGYCKGNQLALRVLGSFLHRKSKLDWENALENLKRSSDFEIYDVLKISYNELNPEEKSLFLDIACFFVGEDKNLVTKILDDSNYVMNVLVDKSLLRISRYNKLQMHSILIVSLKSIFIWGVTIRDIHLGSRAFENMTNLRLLKFYLHNLRGDPIMSSKVHLDQGLDYLPEELRYLHWHGYPLRTLPTNLSTDKLVVLNLPCSNVELLWEEKKEAFKLKSVDLCNSQNLTRMPDLSETPNLERMYLLNCTNLPFISSSIENLNNLSMLRNIKVLKLARTWIEEVPSSIESLTNLEVLDLAHCKRLNRLSASICKLKSLSWLRLYNCSKLESFPGILENMARLEYIDLRLTAIKELPSSVEHLEGLKELRMEYCYKLSKLPDNLGSLRSLKRLHTGKSAISQLPSSIADLKQVDGLSFYGCRGLVLTSVLSGLSSLQRLDLRDCDIIEIPQDIGSLLSLEKLDISGNNFESLPASIKQLSQLRWLYLRNCNRLKSLPELPFGLCFFDARNCKQLQSLPEIPSCPEELQEIDTSILETLSNHSRIYFNFINCLKLNDKANKKILADSKLRIQRMAIASLRLSMYVKEYREPPVIKICLPGNEIPDWFSHQCLGSSLTVQLPQHTCNGSFIGFAFCIVIVLEKDHKARDGIYYHFEIKTPSGTKTDHPSVFEQSFHSDQVILGFFPCWNIGLLDNNVNISLQFSVQYRCFEKGPKVHSCGVCPVYAHPNGTKPNTFTVNVLPPNEEECTQIRKLHYDFHDNVGTSGNSESIDRSGELEVESICREQINAPQQQRSSLFSHIIAKGGGLYAFLA
ncbi:Disease resistance-like protein DSC1 [Citrus sinensis]|uniref:Disease resistance-like protein DSC1 n=1 Tax=Citrus sinensis TaxID=2711 RepID=A0ACB8MBN5_CITSI|nr:Disease resistance-like protein DSC1 [Citrus sinensis]